MKFDEYQRQILELVEKLSFDELDSSDCIKIMSQIAQIRLRLIKDAVELGPGELTIIDFQIKCFDDVIRDHLNVSRWKRLEADL